MYIIGYIGNLAYLKQKTIEYGLHDGRVPPQQDQIPGKDLEPNNRTNSQSNRVAL